LKLNENQQEKKLICNLSPFTLKNKQIFSLHKHLLDWLLIFDTSDLSILKVCLRSTISYTFVFCPEYTCVSHVTVGWSIRVIGICYRKKKPKIKVQNNVPV